jgi:glutamine amidotransferase
LNCGSVNLLIVHKIVIVDYGMGNLRSVHKALTRVNIEACVTSEKEAILGAEKLILPGVGHFKNGMAKIQELGLIEILQKKIMINNTPVLGICLGMQLFTKHSEEGDCAGLGFIDAITVRFRFSDKQIKIPHMGWNSVAFSKDCLWSDPVYSEGSYYFVHSYHVECMDKQDIIGSTDYGYTFVSAIQKKNITGIQFHPEKSFNTGLQMLKKFCS